MGKVVLDMSVSLDGFVTASEVEVAAGGAVIAGRHTYQTSVPRWGADGPTGSSRNPVFIVTHEAPANVPAGSVYTFVTDGIHSALEQAKAAAGENDVCVMGGAEIVQQFVRAGLIDEIQIHLVPVLFNGGTRLFDHLGGDHIQLETTHIIETPAAVHLRCRVVARPMGLVSLSG